MVDKKFLIQSLIKYMSLIGNHKNMNGEQKKEWVLSTLRQEMLLSDDLEDIIIEIIDYMILVEKGQIVLNPKIKNVKKILCCFKV